MQVARKHRARRTILTHGVSPYRCATRICSSEPAAWPEDQGVVETELAARSRSVGGIAGWRAGELMLLLTGPRAPQCRQAGLRRLIRGCATTGWARSVSGSRLHAPRSPFMPIEVDVPDPSDLRY